MTAAREESDRISNSVFERELNRLMAAGLIRSYRLTHPNGQRRFTIELAGGRTVKWGPIAVNTYIMGAADMAAALEGRTA